MSEENIASKIASANMTRHGISTQAADSYQDFTTKSKHQKETDDLKYDAQYNIQEGDLSSSMAMWNLEEEQALFKMRDDYNAMVIANLQDFITEMGAEIPEE